MRVKLTEAEREELLDAVDGFSAQRGDYSPVLSIVEQIIDRRLSAALSWWGKES